MNTNIQLCRFEKKNRQFTIHFKDILPAMRGHESRQPCVGRDKYKTAMGLEMTVNAKDCNMITLLSLIMNYRLCSNTAFVFAIIVLTCILYNIRLNNVYTF